MKKVIGGAIAIIIGLPCFSLFFPAFLNLMASIIPLILIIGGCLTIYLKREGESKEYDEGASCQKPTSVTDDYSPAMLVETELIDSETEKSESIEPEPGDDEAVELTPVKTNVSQNDSTGTEPEKTTADRTGDDIPGLLGNTGSLVFHTFDCKFSKSKNCTAVFRARDEAIKQGYKPCGICKP